MSTSLLFPNDTLSSGEHFRIAMSPGTVLDSIVALVCYSSSASSMRARSAIPFSFSPTLKYIPAIFIHFLSQRASMFCCFIVAFALKTATNSFVIIAMPLASTTLLLRSASNFASFFAFWVEKLYCLVQVHCCSLFLSFCYFQYCSC